MSSQHRCDACGRVGDFFADGHWLSLHSAILLRPGAHFVDACSVACARALLDDVVEPAQARLGLRQPRRR